MTKPMHDFDYCQKSQARFQPLLYHSMLIMFCCEIDNRNDLNAIRASVQYP